MTAEIIPLHPDVAIPEALKWISPGDRHVTPEEVLWIIWVPYYDIQEIARLEKTLAHTSFDLPAKRSPDIETIFWVIKQIIWKEIHLEVIHNFLENTSENTARFRADLQRCGALLQKIAWVKSEENKKKIVNWEMIFSRLGL